MEFFLQAARINHSCNSNSHRHWNSRIEKLTIHAKRHIKAGEEITISYMGPMVHKDRQRISQGNFGFVCDCTCCSLPETEKVATDRAVSIMTRAISGSLLGRGKKPMHQLLKMLQAAANLAINDNRLPNNGLNSILEAAVEVSIYHKDGFRSLAFSNYAYMVRKTLDGEDSQQMLNLKQSTGTIDAAMCQK